MRYNINVMSRVFVLALVITACNNSDKVYYSTSISRDSINALLSKRSNEYQIKDQLDSLEVFLDSIQPSVNLNYDDGIKLLWVLNKLQLVKRQEKEDSVSYYLERASTLSKSPSVTKKGLLNFYIIFGNLMGARNQRDSALRLASEAYHLSIQIDSFRYAETCFDLAEIYADLNDVPNARKYIFEAWQHRNHEPEQIPYIGGLIVGYYDNVGQTDSALYFIKKLEEDSSLIWNTELREANYEYKAYFLNKQSKHGQALENLFQAKVLTDELNQNYIPLYFELAKTFDQLKLYDKAGAYIDSALFLSKQRNNFSLVKEGWKLKAEMYSRRKLFDEAYIALDSAYAIYIVEMDSSLRNYGRELETKYEVRGKDAAIKSLAATNEANEKIRRLQSLIIVTLSLATILSGFIVVLLWRRRQNQILTREAHLRQQILRAQMEPHFLYNMLSLLQMLILKGNRERSIECLVQFSRLLRLILDNAGKSFVPLKVEVDALESYLGLQKMFYEGNFEYEITIESSIDLNKVKIPPMVLQPFAENTILHGFKGIGRKGKLSITLRKVLDSLHCIIDDNGVGLLQSAQKSSKRSLGTEITAERIAILGKQIRKSTRLTIIDKNLSNEGDGVRVELEVPYVEGDE